MKSQKIKFDKNKDYFFVEGVGDYLSKVELFLGPRTYNSKIVKISDRELIVINCWLFNHTLVLIMFTKDNGIHMPEGETIALSFDSLKDMQEFIKENYEVTDDK